MPKGETQITACCILSVAQGSLVAVVPAVSQYHAQDILGQYSYGYSGGPSAKQELRTADGVTQGGYSYIDANNLVQSVSYVSDPVNGFRVAATNIPQQVSDVPLGFAAISGPQETPEVIAAKIIHFQAHAAARAALHSRKRRSVLTYSPVLTSQYHTQDSIGQYLYGYNDGLSSKAESRAADGTTSGGYSYVDANGIIQNVHYTADSLGFRVAATNLPVGPSPLAAFAPAQLYPHIVGGPAETPDVVAAKAAHFAAHAEARARLLNA